MNPDDRFLAFAAVQAAILGAVAGAAAQMTVFVPIDTAYSSQAAVAATWLVRLLVVLVGGALVVALALPGPEDRAGAADGRRRWPRIAATVAVVGLAAVLAAVLLFVALLTAAGGYVFLAGGALFGAIGALTLGAVRLTGRRPLGGRETPFSTGRVAALVVAFVLAFVIVPALAAPADHVVRQGVDVPESDFEFAYEPVDDDWGVLTVTHDGGEPVDPGSLSVGYRGVNESYPDVDDVDQYESGPWAGEASGPPAEDGSNGSVVEGDSVRVAVRSDCQITLLYSGSRLTSLGGFACPDHEPTTPETPAS